MRQTAVLWGVSFLLFGVILGAMAAHSLEEILSAQQIDAFRTGVHYQVIHGLALLVLGLWPHAGHQPKRFRIALRLIIAGVLLFSLSIYLLELREAINLGSGATSILGPFTPIGGTLMIIGWAIMLYHFAQSGVGKRFEG